jgi:hypothetical protein
MEMKRLAGGSPAADAAVLVVELTAGTLSGGVSAERLALPRIVPWSFCDNIDEESRKTRVT